MQSQDIIRNLIHRCIESFKALSSEAVASEELARFRVWTGNAGMHRNWEHDLRDASHIRNQITSLLEDLDACLRNVGNIKNGHAVPWDQPSVTENISELYVNESTEAMQRKEYDVGFHSEKEQMRAEMVEIVDCLYQLTASVHNPAPHDRYMLMKETFDVSKYEQLETENILRNFPSIQPELAARLGQANTRRRQYLSNRRAIYREGQNWSAASFTASIEDVTFPQIDDRKPGICPCCFMLFTPGLLRGESWQKHIYDDLTPYICLEDDCHNSAQYKTIDEWVGHLRQHHGRTWTCRVCLDTFSKSILFRNHLETEHALLDTRKIDALTSSGLEKTDNPTKCPICAESLEDFESYELHLGRHQEQVAFSILNLEKQEASSTRGETKRHAPDEGMSKYDSKRARKYTPETSPEL
ncbi:hypothetical protein BJ166DRAFT_591810 [Pestalotiopsis sp. NC0098]|nr:hypothetical protein BJ166DRAFT_591810 [Pestalotiopsis sp. NC0098]